MSHTLDQTAEFEVRTLQAAMLLRFGIQPDGELLRSGTCRRMLMERQCDANWIVSGARSLHDDGNLTDEADAVFGNAHRRGHMSMMNLCRSVLEILGQRVSSLDESELVQRAASTSQLQVIFTTAFNAQLIEGFNSVPDTTSWCRRIDLPNFQPSERIQMGKYARLTRRTRGNTADQGTIDAKAERLRVFEYASKFVVDEQDFIDDTFGSLKQVTPQEMGNAAAELEPDLIYSTLMSNPTMESDSTALFHADHGNLGTSKPLNTDNLSNETALFDSRTLPNSMRLIGVTAGQLLVSPTLRSIAKTLLRSEEIRDTTANTRYGTANPNKDSLSLVVEPRLRTGLQHPETGADIAGEANNWYVLDVLGRHSLELAYLAGRGRVPRSRRISQADGYVMGWNIDHAVGCGAVGYEGIRKEIAS